MLPTTSRNPVSILYKSIAGRSRPVRIADGPKMARYRFIKNASWEEVPSLFLYINYLLRLQSNLNGSNIFVTMEIRSRHG